MFTNTSEQLEAEQSSHSSMVGVKLIPFLAKNLIEEGVDDVIAFCLYRMNKMHRNLIISHLLDSQYTETIDSRGNHRFSSV